MISYSYLIIMGLTGIVLSAYFSFQVSDPGISFASTVLSYVLSLVATFAITKRGVKKECDGKIDSLKKEHKIKINKLKREHDAITLEKTIRDGTQTLIKNAVDYFKLENIKKEMSASAAIRNLQLDKYGQIIDLLAEFSLILPDRKENQQIVQGEIHHQILIYKNDEKDFAQFLQRILERYLVTVNKKVRERKELNPRMSMKRCPRCAERILTNATICKHCKYKLKPIRIGESEWIRKGTRLYRSGNLQEALSFFTNAIDLNPKSAQAYYNRGRTYEKIGNPSRAVNDLRVAKQLGYVKAKEALTTLSMMDTQEWTWEQELKEKSGRRANM